MGRQGRAFGVHVLLGSQTLAGDTNDYIGKGISGGRIVVRPPDGSTFVPE
ncbi:MAG TPA: hypothetical protein EYP14_18140, partial [Planctomycetaceae bacterium]|nr:hypothetical protein [Planctomycetaceae bacterium]